MQNLSCFPGTTNLEQQLPLPRSCSNVRVSLSVPTLFSCCPHGEPLSGSMLAPSSSTKVAVHICARRCIQSGESQQRPYGVTVVDLSSASHPTLTLTSHPSSSTKRAVSIVASVCVYTTASNKNYQESSWITVMRKSLL